MLDTGSGLWEESVVGWLRYAWVVVGVGFVSLLLVQGAIYSFAVLLPPLEATFHWSRTQTASIFSIFLLTNAVCLPLFGRMIDVYDPRLVFGTGAVLTGVGFVFIQFVNQLWHLYLLYIVIGIGGTAISIGTIAPVVARRFDKQRGIAIGITMSGFSIGRLVLIPLAATTVVLFGWQTTTLLLGLAVFFLLLPITLFIRSHTDDTDATRRERGSNHFLEQNGPNRTILSTIKTKNFVLLLTGYMICGFTVMFFAAHFIAFAIEQGISSTLAGTALGIEGGGTIIGLLAIGALSDRVGRKLPLAGVYFVRGFIFIAFILVEGPVAIVVLAFLFGVFNLASIPMVTALTHELFGGENSGMLYALLTSGHQVAGAVGVFVAGLLYDLTGSYQTIYLSSFVLLMVAALASLLVDEGRSPRNFDRPRDRPVTGAVKATE